MTLTEAAYWTRRLGVLALGALGIFAIVVAVFLSIDPNAVPPEYLTANYACTDTRDEFIPYTLDIPSLELAEGSNLVYELETETGQVDQLPRIVNVHKFNNLGQSLNSQAEAQIIAGRMGFDPNAILRSGSTKYVWNDSVQRRTLEIDARTMNFNLSANFSDSNLFPEDSELPQRTTAINDATNFLRSNSILLADYIAETPSTTYININPDGSFSQAPSAVDAELIRVDFFREKSLITFPSSLEGSQAMKESLEQKNLIAETETIATSEGRMDIYKFNTFVTFPYPSESNISVYIGPPDKGISENTLKTVYAANYTYWPVNEDPCGTYELIPPSKALDIVQKGEASLVFLNEKHGDEVIPYRKKKVSKFTIFSINIGYYEATQEIPFLQPIYIVSGEATLDSGIVGNFHYYVPAISYDLVSDKQIVEDIMPEEDNSFF